MRNNSGRGSIIYIKENIDYKEVSFLHNNEYFEEALFIELNTAKNEKLLCTYIYRRGETSDEMNDHLLDMLKEITGADKYKHILIMGDFNLKDINWEVQICKSYNPNNYSNRFIECVRDCFLTQHVQEPTRQRGSDNPSCLDLVFTNNEDLIDQIEYLAPLGKSDHSLLKFDLKLNIDPPAPKITVLYEKGNYEKFRESMSQIEWEVEFENYPNDVEKQWKFFIDKFQEFEKNYVPRKKVFINGKKFKKFSVPLNQENLRKLKKKNKKWSKIRKNMASEEEKLQYNRLRNQIRRMTLKGKKLLEKTVAKNAKSNPKAFWKYAQTKLNQNKTIPDIINNNDEKNPTYATTDDEKANIFLNYFSSVFTEEPSGNMPFFEKREYSKELDNLVITEETI